VKFRNIFSISQTPFLLAITGLGVLLVAFLVAMYDYSRSDEDLLKTVEQNIQTDFNDFVHKVENQEFVDNSTDLLVCRLAYDTTENEGKLLSWMGHHYLPPFQNIAKLSNLSTQKVLNYGNKIYYQIRKKTKDGIYVFLIPISIKYEIVNDFLKPYIFLGRYYPKISQADIQQVTLTTIRPKTPAIVLRDTEGRPLFFIENIPILQIRKPLRSIVLGAFCLGWCLLIAAGYHI
jgi:hypothetical protein